MKVLAVYPEIQKKMRNKIADILETRDNLSCNNSITLADRESLPYIEAFIEELLRHASLAPLCLPHGTMKVNTCGKS